MKHLAGLLLILSTTLFAQQAPPQNKANSSAPGYSIAGQIVDSISGQPLQATVSIAPAANQESRTVVKTGSDGRFSFNGLRADKYSLMAIRRNYPLQFFEQHDQYSSAVVVGDGLDSTHILFRMQPGASIRGKIVDEANEPVRDAHVRLFETRFDSGHRVTRLVEQTAGNDLGEYSFSKLSEGSYYVAVSANPWYAEANRTGDVMTFNEGRGASTAAPAREKSKLDVAFPLTFYDSARDSSQAMAIDLSAGDRFEANFQLVAEPAVHVTAGTPAPIVQDAASTQTPAPAQRTRPLMIRLSNIAFDGLVLPIAQDMGGEMAVSSGVAPGHYVLEITMPNDGRPVYQEMDLTSDLDLRGVSIPPAATVGGSIQFPGAIPKEAVGVSLRNVTSQRSYGARLQPDGSFQFAQGVLPGRYELAVGSSSSDIYLRSCVATGSKLVGRTLIVGEGATVTLSITAGQGLAKIDGAAELEGKGFAGAMVVLVPQDPAHNELLFRRDQSDSDGTFTLQGVVPGKYTVIALRNAWKLSWADPKVLASYLPDGTRIEIGPRENARIKVQVK